MRFARALTLFVVVSTLTPLAPTALAAEGNVVFAGHGWGHGVGLSQYGSQGMALDGWSSEEIVEYYFAGTQVTPISGALTAGSWLRTDPDPLWVNITGSATYGSIEDVSFKEVVGEITLCQQEPAWVGTLSLTNNGADYSPYVELLEERLLTLGFDPITVDGIFDTDTVNAVKAFQSSVSLNPDGLVGEGTKNALWEASSGDRCVIETPLDSVARLLTPNADGTECTLAGSFAPGACVGSVRNLSPANRVAIPEKSVGAINGSTAIQLAHGTVQIRPDFDWQTNAFEGIHVVLEIDVNEYVYGIDETLRSFHMAALEAQAIASRSYAMGTAYGYGPQESWDTESSTSAKQRRDYCWCHLYSTVASQVYEGYYSEIATGGIWKTASDNTDDLVIDYPGVAVVTAYFSSSNGGASERNSDIWGGTQKPYLDSVPDPWSLEPTNPYDDWTDTNTPEYVASRLGFDSLVGVGVISRNVSGSAKTVRFAGMVAGSLVIVDKSADDWVTPNFGLRSNYFDVEWGDISGTPPPAYGDIDGHLFENDIQWAANNGITISCNPPTNTLFCPDRDVSREEMAVFMTNALDLPAASKDYFIDDESSPFEDQINRLAESGITRGCNPPTNNKFCPGDSVDRGQMAAFLVRAFGLTANGGGDLFIDDDNSIFENDIDKLGTAGITKGCNPPTNNKFCPTRDVERGAMMAFLHRALEP